eukprot:1452755-Alexandrium_andersonii.AAC.1
MRIKDASSRARVVEAQSMSEAPENQRFNPKGVGSEAHKGSRAQRVAPSASSARTPQLFSATHLERGSPAGGRKLRGQHEQAGCIGST